MPAPSKLDPAVTDQLVRLVGAGVTIDVAAAVVGISERTFYEWMRRGQTTRAADREHREFRERVEQARAMAEVGLLAQMNRAARAGSWRAAAWLLERRYPERWGAGERPVVDDASADALDRLDELAPHRRGKRKDPA